MTPNHYKMKETICVSVLILNLVLTSTANISQVGQLIVSVGGDWELLGLKKVNSSSSDYLKSHFNGTRVKVIKFNHTKTEVGFEMNDNSTVKVTEVRSDNDLAHYKLVWTNVTDSGEFCTDYGHQEWFQTYEERFQRWPLNKHSVLNRTDLNTYDFLQESSQGVGGLIETLWISSSGFGVFADKSSSLFIRRNPTGNGSLCLSANMRKPPYQSPKYLTDNNLILHLITSANIKKTYLYARNLWFKKSVAAVDERMIRHPIWSTWAKYKKDINQTSVLEFAEKIKSLNLTNSQVEIDDKWEKCYGDTTFDESKFPNATDMVQRLHQMGFRVTLWVHLFVNCPSSSNQHYLIKNKTDGSPWNVRWWNGLGTITDVTDNKAWWWFKDKLENLKKQTGLDGYKFDGGEVQWITSLSKRGFKFADNSVLQEPSNFTNVYVDLAGRFGGITEVRTGYENQDMPIFFRMLDKESNWGYDNGLKTLIPTALTYSMAGYPFVLPDIIAGNAYTAKPTKELFIRWLQCNVFMPSLQFSIPPWDFDDETVAITQKMLQLHLNVSSLIIKLANESVETGLPILRPIWWIAPEDSQTFTIEDQFLVGDELLVAPVLEKGARKRDVYLPRGSWTDHRGRTHDGGKWIKELPVDLDEIAYFRMTK